MSSEQVNRLTSEEWDELYGFHTISDFKRSISWGAEVVIEWNGKEYGIWPENGTIRMTSSSEPEREREYDSVEEALEFMLGEDRLGDVLTQVTVIERTL